MRETATSRVCDSVIRVDSGQDFEVLWALRGLLRGVPIEAPQIGGVPRETIVDLFEKMTTCRSGVVFFGFGLARRPVAHLTIEALMLLTSELNARTRFYVRRLRGSGDVTGADNVLAWQTGYPFSVNLSRGYPRYNPGEFSANDSLERGEPDVCLLVGSFGVRRFTAKAQSHLGRIPDDRPRSADGQIGNRRDGPLHHVGLRCASSGNRLPDGRSADPAQSRVARVLRERC